MENILARRDQVELRDIYEIKTFERVHNVLYKYHVVLNVLQYALFIVMTLLLKGTTFLKLVQWFSLRLSYNINIEYELEFSLLRSLKLTVISFYRQITRFQTITAKRNLTIYNFVYKFKEILRRPIL